MSLIPSAVQGAPSDNYFAAAELGTLLGPSINAVPGRGAAVLSLNSGPSNPVGHDIQVNHYAVNTTGGGLSAGQYQCFIYGPDVGGNNVGYAFSAYGIGNNSALFSCNRGRPLDASRIGSIVGTGAVQNVAVPSILATSVVQLSFSSGTPAAAAIVPVITANVGFAVTLPAGASYNYEVIA